MSARPPRARTPAARAPGRRAGAAAPAATPAPAAAADDGGGGSGTLAIVLGGAGCVLGAAALVVALRRAPEGRGMRRALGLALALAALLAPPALAHQGNPNYLSQVDAITPATQGVTVDVLNRDDRLLLHNTSGEDVVIEGYDTEPYARVLGDGTVEVNTNSEAYYLNDDRYANAKVPKGLPDTPAWKEIDKTGRFEWHDHRMHWMAQTTPPQVTDKDARTKIFDYRIPIQVAGRPGAIAGTLFWTPLPAEARRSPRSSRARRSSSRSASSWRSCATGAASPGRSGRTEAEAW